MESGQDELVRLTAEQAQDAGTNTISPEFPEQVPFTDGLANCIGMNTDGEIVTNWPRPPKGTLLVGSADWHGTYYGYKKKTCRCKPCTKANKERVAEHRRRRLNEQS